VRGRAAGAILAAMQMLMPPKMPKVQSPTDKDKFARERLAASLSGAGSSGGTLLSAGQPQGAAPVAGSVLGD